MASSPSSAPETQVRAVRRTLRSLMLSQHSTASEPRPSTYYFPSLYEGGNDDPKKNPGFAVWWPRARASQMACPSSWPGHEDLWSKRRCSCRANVACPVARLTQYLRNVRRCCAASLLKLRQLLKIGSNLSSKTEKWSWMGERARRSRLAADSAGHCFVC